MMLYSVTKIDWKDYTEFLPAFLVMTIMPLSFSIATGLAVGFISYSALKLFNGQGRTVPWFVYLLSVLFILRFVYLKAL
jgi:AGZA family xanthine/uracil permease-like MFS transporter